ncbi:Microtubule-associated serine/threonine-protein kinase 4 isoform X22 [Lasiodiplodia theobromae]|uniref:Microtubule-associated serine/threonine-protein kinase 4 isoform X22 n=1 Tax=Lasiodiplodia theobromae TaxID=45133 RepID=UPI0015C30F28|nr:Microtubule-associated serine/threonine-protein kinase 4 isoform X22 [Lasiodiplodia theobromae]KAF4537826.1 Microtubule-associated serine/threonine-protein kinase 4 isoform X22 [Lasiodiplodia theobromae]
MPAQKKSNLTNGKRDASWVKVPSGGPQLPNGSSAKQDKRSPADDGNGILDLELDELSALLEPVGVNGCGGKSDRR